MSPKFRKTLAGIFSLLFFAGALLIWFEEIQGRKIEFSNHSMHAFLASLGWAIILGIYAIRTK
jgi:hypothetical protein